MKAHDLAMKLLELENLPVYYSYYADEGLIEIDIDEVRVFMDAILLTE